MVEALGKVGLEMGVAPGVVEGMWVEGNLVVGNSMAEEGSLGEVGLPQQGCG